jgi:hypothetical protein
MLYIYGNAYVYICVYIGMISNWPATEKWTKFNFTLFYGNKSIKSGSQSSLAYKYLIICVYEYIYTCCDPIYTYIYLYIYTHVYTYINIYIYRYERRHSDSASGYEGGVSETVTDTIRNITEKTSLKKNIYDEKNNIINYSDLDDTFVFDLNILKSIPELKTDFRVPGMFRYWDNIENDKLGIFMNMYMFVYIYLYFIYIYKYLCMNVYVYVCINIYRMLMHIYIYIYVYIYMYIYTYPCIHIYIHVCTFLCMYRCIYINIYIFTYTYIYMFIFI